VYKIAVLPALYFTCWKKRALRLSENGVAPRIFKLRGGK
jgi:hypothetical protein